MAEVPDELIKLERSAERERATLAGLVGEEYHAQWARWRKRSFSPDVSSRDADLIR
ncbi:hypothetical protein AB0L75_43765 [Streptomyces sp. NPDC052101]|uniref:hypothetical protein n=1 Tax=Streptomyces sp. NPDC052101 TaxID=3155763 RepID=UPI0034273BEE